MGERDGESGFGFEPLEMPLQGFQYTELVQDTGTKRMRRRAYLFDNLPHDVFYFLDGATTSGPRRFFMLVKRVIELGQAGSQFVVERITDSAALLFLCFKKPDLRVCRKASRACVSPLNHD
jgi:hypothetical protein